MRWFFLWLLVQFCTWGLDIVQICEFSKFFFPIFVPQNAKLYTNNESCQGALCSHFINDIKWYKPTYFGSYNWAADTRKIYTMCTARKCTVYAKQKKMFNLETWFTSWKKSAGRKEENKINAKEKASS